MLDNAQWIRAPPNPLPANHTDNKNKFPDLPDSGNPFSDIDDLNTSSVKIIE